MLPSWVILLEVRITERQRSSPLYISTHWVNSRTPIYKVATKDKDVESNAKDKSTEMDFSKLVPQYMLQV